MTDAPAPVPIKRVFPRRAFVAALLSGITAAGAVGLAVVGGLSAPAAESFQFARSTAFVAGEETRLKGFLTTALKDDRIDVVILGHSGTLGDGAANLELSEARAAAALALAEDLGIATSRLTARGVGGGAPLVQEDGEGDRAYQSRLSRVEVTLQMRR